jgi:nickel-dependent lactate racemase
LVLVLPYGINGLRIELDDAWETTVAEPRFVQALPDALGALKQALEQPLHSPRLADRVRPSQKVGIVLSDLTRPVPTGILLDGLLTELAGCGKTGR